VISRNDPALPLGQTETEARFLRRIVTEAKKGPNFAGHYTIVIWSCGSPCRNLAVVNVETGESYHTPFIGVLGWGSCDEDSVVARDPLSYRIDSSLLVVTGTLEIADYKTGYIEEGPCGRYYYDWNGHELKLIRSVVAAGARSVK
jgi:hypothetical protein